MNAPRIVVIGSSNTDMVVKMERLPRPGEALLGGEFTQAAGDTFNGALAVALAEKQPLLEAVRFAQAAALSVTRRGAQESAPRREEIDGLLKHGVPNAHL